MQKARLRSCARYCGKYAALNNAGAETCKRIRKIESELDLLCHIIPTSSEIVASSLPAAFNAFVIRACPSFISPAILRRLLSFYGLKSWLYSNRSRDENTPSERGSKRACRTETLTLIEKPKKWGRKLLKKGHGVLPVMF